MQCTLESSATHSPLSIHHFLWSFCSSPSSSSSNTAKPILSLYSKLNITSLWHVKVPSVLWRCWLGGRRGIRPVKNWAMRCWRGYLSGARCRLAYAQLMPLPLTVSLASVKSRLVLPFWYRPSRVVLEKGPLNGCVCVACKTSLRLSETRPECG